MSRKSDADYYRVALSLSGISIFCLSLASLQDELKDPTTTQETIEEIHTATEQAQGNDSLEKIENIELQSKFSIHSVPENDSDSDRALMQQLGQPTEVSTTLNSRQQNRRDRLQARFQRQKLLAAQKKEETSPDPRFQKRQERLRARNGHN